MTPTGDRATRRVVMTIRFHWPEGITVEQARDRVSKFTKADVQQLKLVIMRMGPLPIEGGEYEVRFGAEGVPEVLPKA